MTTFKVVAQRTLDSMIVVSTGDFKPSVIDAVKISDNPTFSDSTQKISVAPFGIDSHKANANYQVDTIKAAKMEGEPLTKLYNALIKLGLGTYSTPYAELWFNNLRSKEYVWGTRYKHLSSSATYKNYGFGGFSDNEFSLYGKRFLKDYTMYGDFDYKRNVVHFYGYDPSLHSLDKDFTAQRFNLFNATGGLKSHYTQKDKINHDIKLNYYNLADLYKVSENNINAEAVVQTQLNKEVLKVNGGIDFYNYKTTADTINNTIIMLNPNFVATGDKYIAAIGVTAVMDVFVQSKFYFYPNVILSYNVIDEIIIPYIGATGGLQKNSFRSLTDENPFVLSELSMKNTNKKYELYGGIKGTLSSKIAFNAKASYSGMNDIALFVNYTEDILKNRFNVIYDAGEVLNIRGEVSYQLREKLRINLNGDYFNYKMKTELKAWYKPQVKVALSANYNLEEKIVAKINVFYIDSQFAKTIDNTQKVTPVSLKGVFDVNLGAEYRYTKKLGFFFNLNNVAAMRYNRWLNYPTQRFSLMGGVSYSF